MAKSDPENQPPDPTPSPNETDPGLVFSYRTPAPNEAPQGSQSERGGGASAAGQPPAEQAPDLDLGQKFKIEWFDEERPLKAGQIFAEPPPEPPLLPFEILHEPKTDAKPGRRRQAKSPQLAATWGAPSASARPSIWVRLFWGLIPLVLLLGGYGSVILTQSGIGHSWDEAYYYGPSLKAAEWVSEVLRGARPFDRGSIDTYWKERSEHPSVQKFLSGVALHATANPRLHLWAMRLPIAILFGMTLMLIYWLGRRAWGPLPGLAAALIYATMPRVFGHAHFASMETPLIFMTLLVVFCYLRGLDSAFWAALTGVSFGLLLATKINGFFLPLALIPWGHLYARRKSVNNLIAMIFLGPVVFVAAWPWLWHDTAQRILEYLSFHARHQMTALYFMGRTWGYDSPNAPWYYPSMIVGVTLPITALALILWGLLRTLASMNRRPVGGLYLLCALVMLGVASAPSTPRYDGERLFLPVFPFLALMGGSGAVGLITLFQWFLTRGRPRETSREPRALQWVQALLCLAVLIDGGAAIARYRPYLLSYFNPLAGGLKGAYYDGYETTYWGEALNQSVIEEINKLPDGSRVMPLALHELCLTNLQLWGLIKPEIKITTTPPADYHLLLMRKGFFRRPERALAETKRFPAVRQWDKFGVPMIALYKTGPEFEQFWPTLPPGSYGAPPAAAR